MPVLDTKLATLDHRPFATIRPRHVEALELLPALILAILKAGFTWMQAPLGLAGKEAASS